METGKGPGAKDVYVSLLVAQGFSSELARQMADNVFGGNAVLSRETGLPDGGKLGVSVNVKLNGTGKDEKDSNPAKK
jgi:hypothetical protein